MVLEVLHDADALIKVVLGVAEDELTNVLPFIWALADDLAVVLEQVPNEEPVEVLRRRVRVLVDSSRQCLAEDQRVYEAARHWL